MSKQKPLLTNILQDKKKLDQLKRKISKQLRKSPKDAWLLAKLSYIYFEEGNCRKALKAGEQAYNLAPDNPVVMWDYGRSLYLARHFPDSLKIFKKILYQSPKSISEKLGWNRSKTSDLQNTCRYEIALCYIQLDDLALAIRWLKNHLSHRGPGIRSFYSIGAVKRKFNHVKRLKHDIDRNKPRLWISLLEFNKLNKNKRIKYRKGFTNGLVIARTAKEAVNLFKDGLLEMGLNLISAEETEEYERRILKYKVDDKLKELAFLAMKDKIPQFSKCYMYLSDK